MEDSIGRIYVLKDPLTQEIRYCGQTIKTLKYRLNEHVQDSKRRKYHSANWIKSLLTRGLKPVIELVEECSIDRLNDREIYYISLLSKTCNLTNIQKGGQNCNFVRHTEETKRKISTFMKSYKKSRAHIDKMRKSLTKPVYQYTLEGVFMQEFLMPEHLEVLGYKKATINHCCRREGTSHGYMWRFYKRDKITPKIPYYKSEEFSIMVSASNRKRSKKI